MNIIAFSIENNINILSFKFQSDKPGTPGSKGRSTTPNAAGVPPGAKGLPPVPAGYPSSPYQRPPDPYQRPPDPAYGRPPMPYDSHGHVRTNGILPTPITGGKP